MASALGLDEVYSELLPADKVEKVEQLIQNKPEKEKLAFVGDGINDAPVLRRADIGIASSYAELESRIQAALDARNALKGKIRAAQARMQEISRQKKAILVYRRTKEVYAKYSESGWSPAFYREHKADIEAHKEAQAVYSAVGGKLPTLAELSEEYDILLSQKRQTGVELSRLSEELKNLRHIKSNMDAFLDDERYEMNRHDQLELNAPECDRHAGENIR